MNQNDLGAVIYRYLLRFMMLIYRFLMFVIKKLSRKSVCHCENLTVLATGTFYSDHWLVTHLRPMANATNCSQLIMVASSPVPEMEKVSGAYAPKWLQKSVGSATSRSLFFIYLAFKKRPNILVGFHLLLNGLLVSLVARLISAKSVYICGGGPREVIGGGFTTENKIFGRLTQADYFIEKQLLKAVNEMDLVVSMGSSAVSYFQSGGVNTNFQIIPGGFDNKLFSIDSKVVKKYDLILIGRLSEVKRVDRFLHALKQARISLPDLNAVIVGDGPDKSTLQQLTISLGLAEAVYFSGWQSNVHYWLQQSRCFILTSDSEGLSQALIQAMMTGLPAVTSNVGDLGDLLIDDYNGYLVSPLTVEAFSEAFVNLFSNESKFIEFSRSAYQETQKYSVAEVEKQWEMIFLDFKDPPLKQRISYD